MSKEDFVVDIAVSIIVIFAGIGIPLAALVTFYGDAPIFQYAIHGLIVVTLFAMIAFSVAVSFYIIYKCIRVVFERW